MTDTAIRLYVPEMKMSAAVPPFFSISDCADSDQGRPLDCRNNLVFSQLPTQGSIRLFRAGSHCEALRSSSRPTEGNTAPLSSK